MKKTITGLLIAAATLCLGFAVASCATAEHTHEYAEGWTQGAETHWHAATCGHDDEREGEAPHTYEDGKCTVCDYEHEAHEFGEYAKAAAGHTRTCSVCNKVVFENHTYKDGACTACGYGHANHTYKDGTCTVCGLEHEAHIYVDGTCSVCGVVHTAHVYGDYERSEEGHTMACTVCHKAQTGAHDYENGVCKECEYAHVNHSYTNGVCTVCGFEHEAHEYGAYTQTADGHSRSCTVCHKEESGTHVYEGGICTECNYAHTGHAFTYSEKTETEHTGTCSVCGKVETTAHTYANGVCADCAYAHTGHTFTYSEKTETEHTGTCGVCGKVETTAHTYEGGACTECTYEHKEHEFDEYIQTEESHTHTCTVCHKEVSAEHAYEKGTCSECGYVHENHSYGPNYLCTVCGAEKPLYVINEDRTQVIFGEYPQTALTDENDPDSSLRNQLTSIVGTPTSGSMVSRWKSFLYFKQGSFNDYAFYIDYEYQGVRYRGVRFKTYRPRYTKDNAISSYSNVYRYGYKANTIHWFKYEPITWRVYKELNGKAWLESDLILDSQEFYTTANGSSYSLSGETIYENNYEHSTIREWLNDDFFKAAFVEREQAIVLDTEVDNSGMTTNEGVYNRYTCNNTTDKVFLLSWDEVSPSMQLPVKIEQRKRRPTDYAKVQGVETGVQFGAEDDEEFGWYWMRSPNGYYSQYGRYIDGAGQAIDMNKHEAMTLAVNCSACGVIPSLWITL